MKELADKIEELAKHKKVTISGLNEGEKAFLPSFLHEKVLILSSDMGQIEVYQNLLSTLGKRVVVLKDKLPFIISIGEKNSKEFKDYCVSLSKLASEDFDIVIATPQVLLQKLPSKEKILSKTLTLEASKNYSLENLSKLLVEQGYKKQDMVFSAGEFALRGDILDIFAVNLDKPIRINFFDDEIESITFFNQNTFKMEKSIKRVDICCNSLFFAEDKNALIEKVNSDLAKLNVDSQSLLRATEIANTQIDALQNGLDVSNVFFLPYESYFNSFIMDYFKEDFTIIVDEPKLVLDKLKETEFENTNLFLDLSLKGEFLPSHIKFFLERKEVLKQLLLHKNIAFTRLISQNKLFESEFLSNFVCPHVPKYVGRFVELTIDMQNFIKNGYTVVLSASDNLIINKIKSFFDDKNLSFNKISHLKDAKEKQINILTQKIDYSLHFEIEKFILVGANNLALHQVVKTAEKSQAQSAFLPQVGEYVVHETHGIGKCLGIQNLKITSVYRDYIIIEYAGGDKLYVPSENTDLLSKFTGEQEPKCNKIGGTEFFKVKQKVKASLKQMAFDLIKVYSERLNSKGFVYSKDDYLQEEFENSFSYPYTDDQLNALREIKKDMEGPRIMDRLLCGDVGFGKTEVALATAFKAIQDGKQVALICPTTILCEQHYATAMERMKKFFVRVESINRFKTKAEQAKILKDLQEGNINLICGTHRLLGADVKFKDLGLIIIDEEQRFGVEDKDKLKNIKKTVDVLSLSATPIPRTLYMSLAGIRDVSFLTTPPKERKKITTAVIDYSDALLKTACEKELARDGQVLIVYNRVDSIGAFYSHVKSLLPYASIGLAHGQMNSKTLETAIYDLYSRKTNILISTILIENGIDLPHANTLFVIDSDKLGLSQLYQLRGRIGRSNIDAYAYFSFKRNKVLTMDSYKRLDAIMEFSDFGSGYKIAMKDLEIRGAGDVLGKVQHGHMQQVGYDMYVKLLGEAVKELKGENVEVKKEIKLNISLGAYIPDGYISSSENRIAFYSAVSRISSVKELNDFLEKTLSTYGNVPKPVEELCQVGLIKNLGQKVKIKQIVLNDFNTKVVFYEEILNTKLFEFLKKENVNFVLENEKLPTIILKKEQNLARDQENLIKFLTSCQNFV